MTVIAQQFPYQKIAYNRHFWIQTMCDESNFDFSEHPSTHLSL